MEKLIIEAENNEKEQGCIIRVNKNAYDLIEGIAKESGRSKCYIASKMIEFAFDHIEIKGVTDKNSKEE